MPRIVMMIVACVATAACGCAGWATPAARGPQLSPQEASFQAVWDASLEVLRRYGFAVDRRDRRAGLITTEPMTGRQFFEFWRRDAATRVDLAESTLQTIYRQAQVTIEPETFHPTVEVRTFRSNRSSPQVTSASEAYGMFTLSGAGRNKFLLDYGRGEDPDSAMVLVGRDNALEQKMEGAIRSESGKWR